MSCLSATSDALRLRRAKAATRVQAAEVLEDRVLPAITLLIDYSLDKAGFFHNAKARAALEEVAAELGSRLTQQIGALEPGYYKTLDPFTLQFSYVYQSAAANTLRVFAGGTNANGPNTNILAQCLSTDSLSTRNYDFTRQYVPFTTTMAVGTTWSWDFDGRNPDPNSFDFKAVMRHELMHGLGIGFANTWYNHMAFDGQNYRYFGKSVLDVTGGYRPVVDPFSLAHYAQGEYSLMQPAYRDNGGIRQPTLIDYATLNDIGWQVIYPGRYNDVLTRADDGTWYAAISAKGLSKPIEFGHWNEAAGWQDVTQGDLNGDGLTDVLGRDSTGRWWAGINTSQGLVNRQFAQWMEHDARGYKIWVDVESGDFNGDGLLDVAGRDYFGSWYVGVNTGAEFRFQYWGHWNNENLNPFTGRSAVYQDVKVGDFNGDRRADIVTRYFDGSVFLALSRGDRFETVFGTAWSPTADWRDVQVADIDGNGMTDLLGRASDGGWYVSLSFGNYLSTALQWTRWNEAAGWRDVTVADFAGDGRPDILGRTATGEWFVAQNIGGVSFSTIKYGAWKEAAGWRNVLTGDFDSNIRNDVLAQAGDGSWWLGLNTGTGFSFRRYGQWSSALGFKDFGISKHLFPASAGPRPQAQMAAASPVSSGSTAPSTAGGTTTAIDSTPRKQTATATAALAIAPVASVSAGVMTSDGGSTETEKSPEDPPVAFPAPQSTALDLLWSLTDADDEFAGLLAAV